MDECKTVERCLGVPEALDPRYLNGLYLSSSLSPLPSQHVHMLRGQQSQTNIFFNKITAFTIIMRVGLPSDVQVDLRRVSQAGRLPD